MTEKYQKIADAINKAFAKVYSCDHSFVVVERGGILFQRCTKCNAMRKMKEGDEK